MTLITVGTLARQTGLSEKAIRMYCDRGLLQPTEVDERSGTRRFDASQVERSRLIFALRALDIPLAQLAPVLDAPPERAAALFDTWWTQRQEAIRAHDTLALRARLRLTAARRDTFSVEITDAEEQLVLTTTASTGASEVAEKIGACTQHLFDVVVAAGAELTGPVFVVYRGRVSDDAQGEIEVCVPVDRAVRPSPRSTLRLEPAQMLAQVALTQAQSASPHIAEVHDHLSSGEFSRQWEPCGPNREIYLPGWGHGDPAEIVAYVATPVRTRPSH